MGWLSEGLRVTRSEPCLCVLGFVAKRAERGGSAVSFILSTVILNSSRRPGASSPLGTMAVGSPRAGRWSSTSPHSGSP